MAQYTQQQLEKKSLLEIRKIARELGITDIAGKKQNEIIRKILTKQKPGGVDPRVKPKEAAAAKAALKKSSKATEPEEDEDEADEDDEADDVPETGLGSVEERLARIEAALLREGLMELGKPKGVKKHHKGDLPADSTKSYEDDEGNLTFSVEDLEKMNFQQIMDINDLLGERTGQKADIDKELKDKPRVARMRLVRFLKTKGFVYKGPSKAKNTADEEDDAEGAEFPHSLKKGDEVLAKYEKKWVAGTVVKAAWEEDGETWWRIEVEGEEGSEEVDFVAGELKEGK